MSIVTAIRTMNAAAANAAATPAAAMTAATAKTVKPARTRTASARATQAKIAAAGHAVMNPAAAATAATKIIVKPASTMNVRSAAAIPIKYVVVVHANSHVNSKKIPQHVQAKPSSVQHAVMFAQIIIK